MHLVPATVGSAHPTAAQVTDRELKKIPTLPQLRKTHLPPIAVFAVPAAARPRLVACFGVSALQLPLTAS
jgi:hypothetical protein